MLRDPRTLLRDTAKEQGKDLKALSLGAGRNHAYLQQFIERGVPKKLPEDVRAHVAAALGISEERLGKRPQSVRHHATIGTPLKGYIGAGGEIETVDAGDLGLVETPPGAALGTVAAEVKGLSMMPAYEDGTLIYWSGTQLPETMLNKRCVVQLADGRIMVKTLRLSPIDGHWNLESLNPAYPVIEDVIVDWVAKIEWTRPR